MQLQEVHYHMQVVVEVQQDQELKVQLVLVELVEQQVLDPLGALALQRLGPEVARQAGELLRQRQHQRTEGVQRGCAGVKRGWEQRV